ncbi:MAG: uroporphyrinogen decarboxylase family protein [Planctomycetaceae bacterium]|nr:uroporphyrinogen decarboxylase family protein [Planctomycetaceae bacterium]
MRLIDMVRQADRRLVAPLAGYPAVNLTCSTVKQNEFNAELQARSLYKLAERTAPDMLFTMMDLSIEAGALGLPVRFPIDESATVEWHPVKSVADLDQYKVIDPVYDGRVWVFLETTRLLKTKLDIPIGAYVIGPFTLAGLMMGANDIAMATIETPEVVQATVNFCERVAIDFAKSLQQAGADAICILDPTSVILSPSAYWEFAGRSVENMVRHLDTRTILHVCGQTSHLLENMCRTGTQGLSLDSMVPFEQIMPRLPGDVVLIGNVDPVGTMLQGNRDKVRRDTTALLEAMRPYENFILSTGCDLPAETPIENIVELVETTKRFKM